MRSWDAAFVARAVLFATLSGGVATHAYAQVKAAAIQHQAAGIVIRVDRGDRTLDVSCDEISDYMSAMEMSFKLRDAHLAETLKAGARINFTIKEEGKVLFAENIKLVSAAATEPEPMAAAGLGALHKALNPSIAGKSIKVGQPVPDFTMTDQLGNAVRLSQFHGKVVALTFGYSRCPNPNYCYRLSNNLAQVQRQLHDRAGRDFILLTIAIDPENDKGAALARYAQSFHADPVVWHFLTGPLSTVREVSAMFGMDFWSNEGLLTHSMHTVIIDREGKIDVNLEGNEFSSRQLVDLVRSAIEKH
jgi:protein SCO1/2